MSLRYYLNEYKLKITTESRSSYEIFLRVFSYLSRYPGYALGSVGCAVIATIAGLAFPKLTQVMIDNVIAQHRMDLVVWMGALLLAAGLLRDVFNFLLIQINSRFEQCVIFDMRSDLYDKLQHLPVNYYDQRATGDLMTRVIDDINAVERLLIDGIGQGSTSLLSFVVVLYMLMTFNLQLTIWALLPFPLLMLGAYLYTITAHQRFRNLREAASSMNALLHDNLQGIRQIKSFDREPHELRRFQSKANSLRTATLRVMSAWSIYSPAMEFSVWIGYVIVFWLGGRAVIEGHMTLGVLVGFLAYIGVLYNPIRQLHGLNQLFQAGRAAGERVFDILDSPVEIEKQKNAVLLSTRVRGDVIYSNVGFAYRDDLSILHDINIHARPGETIALVGPTGAGKSTIVNLLLRFYDITHGQITIDGHDIREVTLESLRRQIGIVSQEAFLFNGTIRENILYGNLDATNKEMISAAQAANCHEFIERLPEGYDSHVGERGVKLSVGEKQRVSIARALLKNPPILILDEATASVDTGTEQLIQEALERLMQHRTSFVIAHRLSTVRNADLILVIKSGNIIEQGTHDELIDLHCVYEKLWRAQSKTLQR